ILHVIVLLLPFLALPIAIHKGSTPPTDQNPIPWLLGLLTVSIGIPFFVVSATSPLLQRWFSATGQKGADDPYFLYAASNFGSLLALVSYPVLIEPHLRLSEQAQWWTAGYIVLAGLTAACGFLTWRGAKTPVSDEPQSTTSDQPVTAQRRLRWVM